MKKIFILIILVFLMALAGGIAFLITRPADYQAHFTVKTTPDVAYYNIVNWNTWNRNHESAKIDIVKKNPVSNVAEIVTLKDTTLIFNWEIKKINDSLTLVKAYVSDPERKIFNRLTAPFINTSFKNSVRSNLLDIKTRIDFMLKTFRYQFTGFKQFEKKSCVYIRFNDTPRGKARAMMSNVMELNQFIRENNFERDGNPFVVVNGWSESKDSASFDFCFPVILTHAVPDHPKIKFMTEDSMKAVKTDFYGNYSITDITWYNLAEEAGKLGYRGNHKLIEVYFNDPHNGGNELEWKAEIYMGIESLN